MDIQEDKRLILSRIKESCGPVEFRYGEPAVCGNGDCSLILAIEKDEVDRPFYLGLICGRSVQTGDAEGLWWRVFNESRDILAAGVTDRRGRFTIPILEELAGENAVKCRLELNAGVIGPPGPCYWRRAPRTQEYCVAADSEVGPARLPARGPIRVVANEVRVTVAVEDAPFGLVRVAAVKGGKVLTTCVLTMPLVEKRGAICRENSIDVRELVDLADPDEFVFDAWPITDDRRTWRHVSVDEIRQALARVEVEPETNDLRDDIQALLDVWETHA